MLPFALTRDVPILVLAQMSSMYEDETFYADLGFHPEASTHDETALGFCGYPLPDPNTRGSSGQKTHREGGYGATVSSSGMWVDGGLVFCGLSYRELQLVWRRDAAETLELPHITVIELPEHDDMVQELRAALRLLFDRNMPERPQIELAAPAGPAVEQLELPFA